MPLSKCYLRGILSEKRDVVAFFGASSEKDTPREYKEEIDGNLDSLFRLLADGDFLKDVVEMEKDRIGAGFASLW